MNDPIEQAFAYLDIGHPIVKAALAEIARLRALESRVLAESEKQEAVTHDIGGRMVTNVETPKGFLVECVNSGLGITLVRVLAESDKQEAKTLNDEELDNIAYRINSEFVYGTRQWRLAYSRAIIAEMSK